MTICRTVLSSHTQCIRTAHCHLFSMCRLSSHYCWIQNNWVAPICKWDYNEQCLHMWKNAIMVSGAYEMETLSSIVEEYENQFQWLKPMPKSQWAGDRASWEANRCGQTRLSGAELTDRLSYYRSGWVPTSWWLRNGSRRLTCGSVLHRNRLWEICPWKVKDRWQMLTSYLLPFIICPSSLPKLFLVPPGVSLVHALVEGSYSNAQMSTCHQFHLSFAFCIMWHLMRRYALSMYQLQLFLNGEHMWALSTTHVFLELVPFK